MFFSAKPQIQLDTFEEMKEIVMSLLLIDCPDHRSQHHILFSTNVKLAQIDEARQHYRKLIDPTTAIGRYAQTAYETANTKYNELQTLIHGYMILCDERERSRFNHNFLFTKEKIAQCFLFLKERNTHKDIIPIEPAFWTSLKAEVLPILAELA